MYIRGIFSKNVLLNNVYLYFHVKSYLSGDMMDNYIGVGECLLMSSVNGAIFALFAAQPLLIVGATGPLMVFDMSLYQVSICVC